MKKRLVALYGAVCILFALSLTGCNGGKAPASSKAEVSGGSTEYKDMGGYEFRIAAWWDGTPTGNSEANERSRKLHEEAQKNYNCKITYLYVPQGELVQKLTASVMANDPFCDIVWLESVVAIPQLAKAGYIMQTDEYFDFSDPKWPAYGVKCTEMGDKHYGFVASIASTYGIWWNKTFFAKNNLPDLYELQQKGEWTWEVFEEICKKATTDTNNDGENETWGIAEVGWEPIVDRLIASNGQAVVKPLADGTYRFNVDNSAVKEAIQFTVDLFQKGYKTDVSNFTLGKVAMFAGDGFWGGNTFQLEMDDELGFVYFPKGPQATDYVCTSINSNIMCLPTNSKRPEDTAMIFEAIVDWENLESDRMAWMESWMYNEEDVQTCLEMFNRCELHKWRAFSGLENIFLEDIFYACVKNNTTLEKAVAEHLTEGQAAIDAVLNSQNETGATQP